MPKHLLWETLKRTAAPDNRASRLTVTGQGCKFKVEILEIMDRRGKNEFSSDEWPDAALKIGVSDT